MTVYVELDVPADNRYSYAVTVQFPNHARLKYYEDLDFEPLHPKITALINQRLLDVQPILRTITGSQDTILIDDTVTIERHLTSPPPIIDLVVE